MAVQGPSKPKVETLVSHSRKQVVSFKPTNVTAAAQQTTKGH